MSTRITGHLNVDGHLDETDWYNIQRIYRLSSDPSHVADFRFGHNDTYLFLGVEVQDPNLQCNSCLYYNFSCAYWDDDSIEIGIAVNTLSEPLNQQLYKLVLNLYNQHEQMSGYWTPADTTDIKVSDGHDVSFPIDSFVLTNGTISPRGPPGSGTDVGYTMEIAIPRSSFMSTPNSSYEAENIYFNFGINFHPGSRYWAANANPQWEFHKLILMEDCYVSAWSSWGPCDCGRELQYRNRSITIPPAGAGDPCPSLAENISCSCDCVISEVWTPCSVGCGNGTRNGTMTLLKLPSPHGECPLNITLCGVPPCDYPETLACLITNCTIPVPPPIVTTLTNDTINGEVVIRVSVVSTIPVVKVYGNLSIGDGGNVVLKDSTVLIYGVFKTDGNLTLSGNSTLNVSGCAILNGSLNVDITKRKDKEMLIIYNCRVGTFREITFSNLGECTKAAAEYQGKALSLSLTKGCGEDWLPLILGVTLAGVLVLVVVVIGVVMRSKKTMAKVFPFRNKPPEHFEQ
eukprot:TRINITY_DN6127_c0_g2_i1.p1 TRINITY_DN6127_c0_g2~~TRINITY_DN6127_c0_g2_i1.p1  ORF type:complete len:515 (-),score=82.44 TRINITY_DN6127_c0_g2_i1:87-1631(-)